MFLGWIQQVCAAGPGNSDSLRTEILASRSDSAIVSLSQLLVREMAVGDLATLLKDSERGIAAAMRIHDGNALWNLYLYKGHALMGLGRFVEGYQANLQAKTWAEKEQKWKMVVSALIQMSECLRFQGRGAEQLTLLLETMELAERVGGHSTIALVENSIGIYYSQKGDQKTARTYFECALKSHELKGDSADVASAVTNLGNVNFILGDLREAIRQYLRAVRIDEELGNENGLNIGYFQLSQLNHEIGDTAKAMEYAQKSLRIAEKLGSVPLMVKSFNQQADWKFEEGDWEGGVNFYNRGIDSCKKYGLRGPDFASSLTGKGNYLLEKGKPEEALQLLFEAEKAIIDAGVDSKFPYVYLVMGLAFDKKGDRTLAKKYLEKGLQLSDGEGRVKTLMDVHMALSAIYEAQGDYAKSLHELQLADAIEDSLFNAENQKGIAEIQAQYDTEREKRKVAEERGRTAEARAATAIAERRTYWVAGWSLLALTIALSGLVVLRTRSKARIKEKEQEAALVAERLQTARQRNQSLEALAQQQALEVGKRVKLVQELKAELETLRQSGDPSAAAEFLHLFKVIEQNLQSEEDWTAFKQNFEQIHPQFFAQLVKGFPDISQAELRLCALIRLGLSQKEIAQMVNITPDSVKRSRNRLRHKLKLEEEQDLKEFLHQY